MNNKWDLYYLEMARHVASGSKDPSTKCGCVIVRKDNSIVSTGFNGFPRGMDDSADRLNNRELKYPRVIHAEMNALLFARENLEEATLYIWPLPCCERCSVHVIQTGIKRVVFQTASEEARDRWGDSTRTAFDNFKECGVSLTEIDLGATND